MITRKNYFETVCMAFTILVLSKIGLEAWMKHTDENYIENLVFMFILCLVATLILALHRFLTGIPLLFIIFFQYLLLLIFNILCIYAMNFFSPVTPSEYGQRFINISVPYIFFSVIYYINYFHEVKRANSDIRQIRLKRSNIPNHTNK